MITLTCNLFIHIFTHRGFAYAFEDIDEDDWMGKHFFTDGIMPMNHPQKGRFDLDRFRTALAATGFCLVASRPFMDPYGWFIADKPK